jgi:hypothetical protein
MKQMSYTVVVDIVLQLKMVERLIKSKFELCGIHTGFWCKSESHRKLTKTGV